MSLKTIVELAKKIPVFAEADVVVVGGGTTGVVAALAAAKNGAKTILIEQSGHLGGTLLGGGLVIQGFFNQYVKFPEAEKAQLIKGIPEQIVNRMISRGGCWGHVRAEVGGEIEPSRVVFDPEVWIMESYNMMKEHGVELIMRTFFVDPLCRDSSIYGVIVENKLGRWAILGKNFVDATADGDVAVRAGAICIDEGEQDRPYECGLIFGMANVDMQRVCQFANRNDIITNLARANICTPKETIVVLSLDLRKLASTADAMKANGMWGPFFGTTKQREIHYINTTLVRAKSVFNPRNVIEAELELRRQVFVMANLLKNNIEGFEEAYLNYTAPLLGVRRSRIIRCEYEITSDDTTHGKGFADEIGRYAFNDLPEYAPAHGGSYGIPYRALIPKKINNLLVAGRMITPQYEAHQSTRLVGCCWVQGEGAGTAAALAANKNIAPRNLDPSLLQQTLLANNVYLEKAR